MCTELKVKLDEMNQQMSLLNIDLAESDKTALREYLSKTFALLCVDGVNEKLDVTYLKYLMHKANLHQDNPALFKKVNDRSKFSNFSEEWTREDFVAFFMNEPHQPREKSISLEKVKSNMAEKPTLDQMVEIFEMLDFSREMKIRVDDLLSYISMFKELKEKGFDIEKYSEEVEKDRGTVHSRIYMDELTRRKQFATDQNQKIRDQLQTFLAHFDTDKDESIGPREFFQIIMSLYE